MKKIAHRGLSALFPENTLSAFKKAVEAGVYAIETDLRVTADHVLVLSHDSVLEKIHAPSLTVEASDYAQLKELDASSWFDLTLPREHIPTLDEALSVIRQQCKLILEIKDHPKTREIVTTLLAPKIENLRHSVEVSSFNDEILFSMYKQNPKIMLHKLIDTVEILENPDFDKLYEKISSFDISVELRDHPKTLALLEGPKRVIFWTITDEDLSAYKGLFAAMSNNPLANL